MKRIIAFLVTTVVLFGCNEPIDNPIDSIDNPYNIDIKDIKICGEASPVWLINKIDSIIQPVAPRHRPVEVYSTVLEDTTYVLITDWANSAYVLANRFFLCSGESISFETEKYNILRQTFRENREEFTLLWSNYFSQRL